MSEEEYQELSSLACELRKEYPGENEEQLQEFISSIVEESQSVDEVPTLEQIKEFFMQKLARQKEESAPSKVVAKETMSTSTDSIAQYLKEMGSHDLLDHDQQLELFTRLRNGETEVKELLVEANLRLVVSIATKWKGHGVEFLDLIQDGNVGLMMAIDRFDPSLGYCFSTYATIWIKQAINRGIAQNGKNIRIPFNTYESRVKLDMKKAKMTRMLGREPTREELESAMGWSQEKLRRVESIQDVVSLNEMIGENQDHELQNFVSTRELGPDEVEELQDLQRQMKKLFEQARLTEREQEILRYRYGFDGEVLTQAQLARKWNVTRERIRQIEEIAINKMRYVRGVKHLAVYTENPEKSEERLAYNVAKYKRSKLKLVMEEPPKDEELSEGKKLQKIKK